MADRPLLQALWHRMAESPAVEPAREAMQLIENLLIDESPVKVYLRPMTWRGVHGWHLSGTFSLLHPDEGCYFTPARDDAERMRRQILAGVPCG